MWRHENEGLFISLLVFFPLVLLSFLTHFYDVTWVIFETLCPVTFKLFSTSPPTCMLLNVCLGAAKTSSEQSNPTCCINQKLFITYVSNLQMSNFSIKSQLLCILAMVFNLLNESTFMITGHAKNQITKSWGYHGVII